MLGDPANVTHVWKAAKAVTSPRHPGKLTRQARRATDGTVRGTQGRIDRRRHRDGPRDRPPARLRGLRRGDVRRLGRRHGQTRELALGPAPSGTKVIGFVADVSDEAQVADFRDFVASGLETDHINLLFNNAGIGGGASFVRNDRAEWERTFGVDWGGVYICTRVFMPMLLASEEGHVVNTSSINGLWASIGPHMAHTAYSTAKFAVRGFTEALITDFRLNAPHLHASVVMPGHIGTSIVINTAKVLGREPATMSGEYLVGLRAELARAGSRWRGSRTRTCARESR